jgi:hypothetical protein
MKTNALIDMQNYEHDHHPLDRKKRKKKKRVNINKKPNNKTKHKKKTQHRRYMKPNNNKKQEDAPYNCVFETNNSSFVVQEMFNQKVP